MNNIEITKREIIVSISILAIMIIIGVLVGDKVNEYQQDKEAQYNKAFKITKDAELFTYAMKTNIGNALVEGELKADKPVNYKDEIDGEYLVLEKIKEKYTMHTRVVTYTDSKGNTHSKTETYWTWDKVDHDIKKAKSVIFLGINFDTSKFDLPSTSYIDTVNGGYHIRYKFYGLESKFNATIFGNLKNDTIANDNIKVYKNMTVAETLEEVTGNISIILFWVLWILITVGIVILFMYLDNNWLNT
ncbi:Uncharacterised protein [[Clostridium] sordellii]|uniref:hypothetical protein n=1 Tax=Paraclostridium sordellii TaxID=1505 RepID=UPI0005DFAE8A|nr:hypothetical protein [Paeniclostridium sordellii]CEQ26584.1 Uncharacterised protein [[Clostridium] sordellii] [Paeniclostridium sordellii]